MTKRPKAKIKMLGNYRAYEAGTIIEISEDEAAMLVSLGYAQKTEDAPVQVEE